MRLLGRASLSLTTTPILGDRTPTTLMLGDRTPNQHPNQRTACSSASSLRDALANAIAHNPLILNELLAAALRYRSQIP